MRSSLAAVLCLVSLASFGCSRRVEAPRGEGPRITQLAAGPYGACARRSDGAVVCWGRCGPACNGHVTAAPESGAASAPPEPVEGVEGAVSVAVGEGTACAARGDGTVWCWGDNFDGALGRVDPDSTVRPLAFPGVSDVVEVAGARNMMCARRRDGTVLAWGAALSGADENPAQMARRAPTAVAGLSNVDALFARDGQCCARMAAGGVGCWAPGMVERDGRYELAYGRPSGVGDARTRAVFGCECVLDDRGVLSCGTQAFPGAMLADGTVPAGVANGCSIRRLEEVTSVAAQLVSACAARKDGTVVCWSAGDQRRTMAIPGRVVQLATGGTGTTYALDERGEIWGWSASSFDDAIPGRVGAVDPPVRIWPR